MSNKKSKVFTEDRKDYFLVDSEQYELVNQFKWSAMGGSFGVNIRKDEAGIYFGLPEGFKGAGLLTVTQVVVGTMDTHYKYRRIDTSHPADFSTENITRSNSSKLKKKQSVVKTAKPSEQFKSFLSPPKTRRNHGKAYLYVSENKDSKTSLLIVNVDDDILKKAGITTNTPVDFGFENGNFVVIETDEGRSHKKFYSNGSKMRFAFSVPKSFPKTYLNSQRSWDADKIETEKGKIILSKKR